ncbi:hypothetical protein LUZ60_015171 [Juncus effusus]|nr:hypothetical protein LUZ60_015171 [Juncus effusus]
MGKRRPSVVVLSSSPSSSDKEDARRSAAAARRRSGAGSSASASSSRKKPRRRSSAAVDDYRKHEFDMLSEEFSECLKPLSYTKELWAEKHKPQSLSDLAVHKKKVEEVKNWLEERLNTPRQGFGDYTLLITGQAGVGKSTVIQVLAKELGFELCEWKTPTPTLWSEHLHNTNSGLRYMSKLEEFETFTEKTRKYTSLKTNTESINKPFVILIDDLPVTNGKLGLNRLTKCLTDLTRLTRFPTIILLTQCHKTETAGDNSSWHWEQLESLIEKAGAHKIAFNPITVNSMKKTLFKITKQEKYSEISTESIEHIAKSSGGDIRNAITSLQYFCLNPERNSLITGQNQESCGAQSLTSSFGKDETLSLFHALGKFLHNKREINVDSELDGFTLKEKYKRNPLKMESPEIILSQSHGQTRSITDFLHENVLDFIDSDTVSDAWAVSAYLSDSDFLVGKNMGMMARRAVDDLSEFEGLACVIAASVSVRGVLFGNSQPATSRWHAIRSPKIWQVEQSMRHTRDEMLKERFENLEISGSSLNLSDLATDFRPVINRIGSDYLASVSNTDKMRIRNPVRKLNPFCDGDLESESDNEGNEDEIEDW